MTNFSDKHKNLAPDAGLQEKIKSIAGGSNRVNCMDAHQLAGETGLSPIQIGRQIDLAEYRISQCALGLFGFDDAAKKLDPEIGIPPELDHRLDEASASSKRISCRTCWEIARELSLPHLTVGSACEKKNLKIKPCQLGAF